MKRMTLLYALVLLSTTTAGCTDEGPADVEEPAGDSATFALTFNATWSAGTHPVSFPPGPHFSGLIGATHNSQYAMWDVGALASNGVKDMAELGSKSALTAEVEGAIQAGTAGGVVSGGGIARSPAIGTLSFDVDSRFPLLSLTSMIAPSPDWFVGVAALNLRPGGEWIDSVTVELLAYDAGTDSGVSYTAPNAATIPPVPIRLLTESPFEAGAPPLGTFTFVRR